jgi:hypothetical protein
MEWLERVAVGWGGIAESLTAGQKFKPPERPLEFQSGGAAAWGHAALHPTEEARSNCVYREFQRTVSR